MTFSVLAGLLALRFSAAIPALTQPACPTHDLAFLGGLIVGFALTVFACALWGLGIASAAITKASQPTTETQ